MDSHRIALILMAIQGCLGAFDTVYHHELTEALPRRGTARLELRIHAIRAAIYSLLFIGLSSWDWDGAWSVVLVAAFTIEIGLTLWDFVIEDRTRLLPATERVTHTVLAINGGAFIALLVMNCAVWITRPTGLHWSPQGYIGLFLALCGIGVGLSSLRDLLASFSLHRKHLQGKTPIAFDFGPKGQQFLVTGATGFIGTKLVQSLLSQGHRVDIVTRSPRHAAWHFDGRVRCYAGIEDVPPEASFDVVINLAGARILGVRWTTRRRNVLVQSRIDTTRRLVAWLEHCVTKPRVLISASAIGYYGIQTLGDETSLDEEMPAQPIFMSDLCRTWEEAACQVTRAGIPAVVIRLGLVLGQGGALPMMLLPVRLGGIGRVGSGQQWISWIHIDDVIGAIAHVSRRHGAARTVYNLTAPQAVRQLDFNRTAAEVLHRPTLISIPGWLMRLLLGHQADLLLEGQRVSPGRLTREGFSFYYPDLLQALVNLA